MRGRQLTDLRGVGRTTHFKVARQRKFPSCLQGRGAIFFHDHTALDPVSNLPRSGTHCYSPPSLAGYATAVEPNRRGLTRYSFTPANWPVGQKLRIAVLTDFHAHPRNMNEADLLAVVARTNAPKPDVTVLLSDYGSWRPKARQVCALCLDAIAARARASRTTVQNAIRQARYLGMVKV